MLYLKQGTDPAVLRGYGFRRGREWDAIDPKHRVIDNDFWMDDYWMVATNEEQEIYYADDEYGQALWSIHANPIGGRVSLYVDCVPSGTYHIDSLDMDGMLSCLFRMIRDGIVEERE